MKPLFTIVTITYNSSATVRETIESVLASSYTDFEYLISDDCSPDNTWEIIQRYNDPRIRSWRNENNLGEYVNRNKVLQEANGKFIMFVDGDDILYKHSLREYSEYYGAFPEAAAIWGVYSCFFDFIVFPYLLSAAELTRLIYLSLYPITVVGFSETLFQVDALKKIGGFNEKYAIGDTYIKKRFACEFPVLLIPAGKTFWRQTPNQATQIVNRNFRNLLESLRIDREILQGETLPLTSAELAQAIDNFKNRRVKLIVKNTLRKGRISRFFEFMRILEVPFGDLKLLFRKGDYSYKAGASSMSPLSNDFNFK